MKIEIIEATWVTGQQEVSLDELAGLSGLAEAELRELVAHEAFEPIDPGASRWTFRSECVAMARTACRLKSDLDLDPHAVSVALALFSRIRTLEEELRRVRAQLPGF